MSYVGHEPELAGDIEPEDLEPETAALERIVAELRQRVRHDFSQYKPGTLFRRVGRRMAIHRLSSTASYADMLEHNALELDLLFKELLIGVTEFFRDTEVWQVFAQSTLPALLEERSSGRELRAWCVGCSTGEEAYSLAIVFRETIERLPDAGNFKLQIFASDINPDAIAFARQGDYPAAISDTVSEERLARFFTRTANGYRVNEEIRSMILFAQHDVILDPPFSRLDLIICRNLLIYFDANLQRKLLPLFHYCLVDEGILMLGSSETIGRSGYLFAAIDGRQRLYRRCDRPSVPGPALLMNSLPPLTKTSKKNTMPTKKPSTPPGDSLQVAADQVLLQIYAPAAVILNNDGDIIYISGRTGKYLEPAAGKANWNFHAMAREGLRSPIAAALKVALTSKEPVQLRTLYVETPTGSQPVNVTVQALHSPASLAGMTIVVFNDIAHSAASESTSGDKDVAAYEAELQRSAEEILALREEARSTREELQAANEELQMTNQELQSTNEELQSTNEELQSINEELTTSKEEMQSINEELQDTNSELKSRVTDLALEQSDMKNLLNSIEMAVVFLDKKLLVRRFNDRASKLVSLRESDAGRPLSDISSILDYPTLEDDARETLRNLQVSEKQVQTSDGRWFTVAIMPYHRIDDVIDGVVITMVEVDESQKLEQ